MEAFLETKTSLEIEHDKKKAKDINELDPCEMLCQVVDDYFHGSNENKTENERARNESMKHPSAKKLIDILEK